jgi:hypothetical protein
MPRIQNPLRPIKVDYKCDNCYEGFYRPTGLTLLCDPPKYPHKCTLCGGEQVFTETYPTIRYCGEGELLDLENYKLYVESDK